MSDQNLYLDQLKPHEAVAILANAAISGAHVGLQRVGMLFPRSLFGAMITLTAPDPDQPGLDNENERELFRAMVQGFQDLKGEWPSTAGDGEALPLTEGLVRILMSRDAPERPAEPKPGEYLIIGSGLSPKRAEDLFRKLSLHATALRVGASSDHFFFHILDDQERFSSFQALTASEELADCRVLTAFGSGPSSLFLERDLTPDVRVLDAFLRLANAAPALFGGRANDKDQPQTLALQGGDRASNASVSLLNLTDLAFFKDFELTGKKAAHRINLEIAAVVANKQQMKRLWHEIQSAEPRIGYRLELRPTRFSETSELERLRLERQRAAINHKLAYLESLARSKPILLRFTAKQLPALADVLRSFPMTVLNDGRLQYGFHASEREPTGLHYLFIRPDQALMHSLDPLFLWQDLDNRPMRFALDPFWARHYHGRGGHALVFTPEGGALYPPMHDWGPNSMDDYLRQVVAQWFKDGPETEAIPEKPIFLFDGKPGANGVIRLTVLDRNRFQPLRMRLGWLNDNLALNHALDQEKQITEMAAHLNRRKLAERLAQRSGEAVEVMMREAVNVNQSIADITRVMSATLNQELDRLVGDTYEMAGRIRALDQELKQWRSVEGEMTTLKDDIDYDRKITAEKAGKARNEFHKLETRVKRLLLTSKLKRDQMAQKIDEEIQALDKARSEMKEKLFNLKLWE